MESVQRFQFSLAALFVVMTAVGVLLVYVPLAFRFAKGVEWSDPSIGWAVGLAGLLLAVVLLIVTALRR